MAPDQTLSLQLSDGRDLPVQWRHHGRSQRLTARLDPRGQGLRVTTPPGIPAREVQRFIDENRDWVEAQLADKGERIALEPGTEIPIEGIPRVIAPTGSLRGLPELTDTHLHVPGEPDRLAARITRFCRSMAKDRIVPLAERKAEQSGRAVRRVTVRDTTSRWGSCTHDGCLSFSWRLILAPPSVLDYVVAHEVAHLTHMDHSEAFWSLNARLADGTMAEAKTWLRRHGRTLFLYG
ncbi:MAG: M48 family metallopeptidase [Alphaproteobacteria bacterium]|nr:M48 family metallopeptidase [Alphaproteobacteria bacterium SS10]